MIRFANPQQEYNQSSNDDWRNRLRLIFDLPKLLTDQQHVVFSDWSKRYGDRFRFKVANQNYVFLSDPSAIKCCFELGEDKLDAGLARRRLLGFLPANSLLFATGPKRQKMRRAIGRAMAGAGESLCVASCVNDFLKSVEEEDTDNFIDRVNHFFLRVISQFLVGVSDNRLISAMAKASTALEQVSTATMIFPGLRRIPSFAKGYAEVATAIAELNEELLRLMSNGGPRTSFLSGLLQQASENEISLPEVIDNFALFCFIMPPSLKSMFQNMSHALATENDWQTQLRNAIGAGTGSQKLIRATVKETMRMAPVIPLVARKALCDLDIEGFPVRKDDLVIVTPYLTHFRASTFPQPEKFDATRFIGNRRYANEFIPYGGGRNHCVGSGWAAKVIGKLFHRLLPIVEFNSPRNHAELREFSMRSLLLKRRKSQFSVWFIQNA